MYVSINIELANTKTKAYAYIIYTEGRKLGRRKNSTRQEETMKFRIPFTSNVIASTTVALLSITEGSRFLATASTSISTTTSSKHSISIWPEITDQRYLSLMAQRDLMYKIPIDDIPVLGVNMQRSFIQGEGEKEKEGEGSSQVDILETFSELLKQGVAAYTFTIEPDTLKETWRLTNSSISFSSVLQRLRNYLEASSTALQVNMILLFLDIQTASKDQLYHAGNLTRLLHSELDQRHIYSPKNLNVPLSSQSPSPHKWPTLEDFLFKEQKRVIIFELSNKLNEPAIFPPTTLNYEVNNITDLSCPTLSVSSIQHIASKSWRFLDSQFTNSDLPLFSQCGYSPILANYYDTKNISQMVILVQSGVLWSWDTGTSQPRLITPDSSSSTGEQKKCAVLHYTASKRTVSWRSENCHSRREVLCRSDWDPFDWIVTREKYGYLEGYSGSSNANVSTNTNTSGGSGGVCPHGYHFGLPSTLLELNSVLLYLSRVEQQDANPYDRDIWINANSIVLDNCWVNGEDGAACPYRDTVRKGTLAALLVPATPIAALVLICAFYLSLLTVPIHDNRKNWRRVIKQISKSEVEGVPS